MLTLAKTATLLETETQSADPWEKFVYATSDIIQKVKEAEKQKQTRTKS